MTSLSDLSLNGTLVSWTANDDTSFDVSCTYADGTGVYTAAATSPFDLSGVVDLAQNMEIVVIGTPSNASLLVSYSAPPPPPSLVPLSDISLLAVSC